MSPLITCPACGRTVSSSIEKCPNCGDPYVNEDFSARPPQPSAPLLPPPPSEQWHVRTADGQQFGPITKNQLDLWVAEQRVNAKCQLWQVGSSSWKPVTEVYPALAVRVIPSVNSRSRHYGATRKRKFLVAAVVLTFVTCVGAIVVTNIAIRVGIIRPDRQSVEQKVIPATSLLRKYKDNIFTAQEAFDGEWFTVEGMVTAIDTFDGKPGAELYFDPPVRCFFGDRNDLAQFKRSDYVRIGGRIRGMQENVVDRFGEEHRIEILCLDHCWFVQQVEWKDRVIDD